MFKQERGEVDSWLAQLNEATMEQQIGEVSKAYQKKRAREDELEKVESTRVVASLTDLKKQILEKMLPSETVTKAMKRLSGTSSSSSSTVAKSWQKGKKPATATADAKAQRLIINTFIENVDACISDHGIFGIYDMTYEALSASCTQWEYKVVHTSLSDKNRITADSTTYEHHARDESQKLQIHGPFASNQIAEWKNSGYFVSRPVQNMDSTSANSNVDAMYTMVFIRKVVAGLNKKKVSVSMFDDDEDDTPIVDANPVNATNPWCLMDDMDFGEYISVTHAEQSSLHDRRRVGSAARTGPGRDVFGEQEEDVKDSDEDDEDV